MARKGRKDHQTVTEPTGESGTVGSDQGGVAILEGGNGGGDSIAIEPSATVADTPDSPDITGADGDAPDIAGADGDAPDAPKTRKGGWPKGKPRGPRSTSPGQTKSGGQNRLDIKTLAEQITVAHQIAQHFTGLPLAIEPEQGKQLAAAITALTDHYGVKVTGPALLWANLIGVSATIYAPKVFMVLAMRAQSQREPERPSATVYDIAAAREPAQPAATLKPNEPNLPPDIPGLERQ